MVNILLCCDTFFFPGDTQSFLQTIFNIFVKTINAKDIKKQSIYKQYNIILIQKYVYIFFIMFTLKSYSRKLISFLKNVFQICKDYNHSLLALF